MTIPAGLAAALWLGCSAPAAQAAPALALVYERTLMSAAGARCRLFDAPAAAALEAAAAQARGAALRGGTAPDLVRAAEVRARDKAFAIPCASPDLATAAERVRQAFAGYARMNAMTFPGETAEWRATRAGVVAAAKPGVKAPPPDSWRLVTAAETGPGLTPVRFGLADPGGLSAVVGGAAAGAYAVRLLLRDPRKAPEPYVDPRRRALSARAAPREATQVFLASARSPQAGGQAAFRFPAAAAAALAGLDPREAATLEFALPGRGADRTLSAWIEVGDFAAGRAFLAAR